MIRAALREIEPLLANDSLRALHEPLPGLFILRFSRSRARLVAAPLRARIHLTDRRLENPHSPSPFVMKLRKHLAGADLAGVEQLDLDRIVVLTFRRRKDPASAELQLVAELMGNHGNLILLVGGVILATLRPSPRLSVGQRYASPAPQLKKSLSQVSLADLQAIVSSPSPHRALAAMVDGVGLETAKALVAGATADSASESAAALMKRVGELLSACDAPHPAFCPESATAFLFPASEGCVPTHTLSEALDQELDARLALEQHSAETIHAQRSSDWEFAKRARIRERLQRVIAASPTVRELRHHADLLLAYGQDLPRGACRFELDDPTTGRPLRIPLRKDLSVVENAQQMYRKARRLERGSIAARKKLDEIEREIQQIRIAPSANHEQAPARSEDTAPSPSEPAPRKRRFILDGYRVDIGRSARENDELLRRASPEDLWLHARGVSGSHVFVRHRDAREIPEHILVHAARLAAQHSKSRNDSKVEVSYTRVKHVRKPRNAPPGLVILAHESTLVVTLHSTRGEASSDESDV